MNFHTAKLTVSLFVSILSLSTFAGTIKGKVTDAKTAEPLVGATVSIENTKYKTVVNLDGSFVFRNIPAGKYALKVKMLGYENTKEKDAVIAANSDVLEMTFQLDIEAR